MRIEIPCKPIEILKLNVKKLTLITHDCKEKPCGVALNVNCDKKFAIINTRYENGVASYPLSFIMYCSRLYLV
jgi:hypothetical protein